MGLIIRWLVAAAAIMLTSYFLPGVALAGLWPAILVALVLGIINAVIKPFLLVLTLPINVLTLGLFTLVINALLIMLASAIVSGFDVAGFWTAFFFSIVLSIVNAILGMLIPDKD